jgi:hypothetical protein
MAKTAALRILDNVLAQTEDTTLAHAEDTLARTEDTKGSEDTEGAPQIGTEAQAF